MGVARKKRGGMSSEAGRLRPGDEDPNNLLTERTGIMSQTIAQSSVASHSPRRLGRSTGAVLAGFLTVVVLSTAVDVVLHATRVFPPPGERMSDALFWLATAYRCVFTVLGGYVTARLAPHASARHAWVLGCIGFAIATLAAVATWGRSDLGPNWYPLMLVVTALPCTVLGGKLSRRV
jgi:hypothetical protein